MHRCCRIWFASFLRYIRRLYRVQNNHTNNAAEIRFYIRFFVDQHFYLCPKFRLSNKMSMYNFVNIKLWILAKIVQQFENFPRNKKVSISRNLPWHVLLRLVVPPSHVKEHSSQEFQLDQDGHSSVLQDTISFDAVFSEHPNFCTKFDPLNDFFKRILKRRNL